MKKPAIFLLAILLITILSFSVSAAAFDAAKGAAVIDAEMDEAYSAAPAIPIQIEANGNSNYATGEARILWDKEALYVYVAIKDKVLTSQKSDTDNVWYTDSVEFYIDLVHTGDDDITTINAAQYTGGLVYAADKVWGGRGMHWDANKDKCTYAAKIIDGGWAFEAKIVWGSGYTPAEGNIVGFTIAINDDADNTDGRENQTFVSDGQSNAWSMTGSYDDLRLSSLEFIPIIEEVAAQSGEVEAAAVTSAPVVTVAAQTMDATLLFSVIAIISGAIIVKKKK